MFFVIEIKIFVVFGSGVIGSGWIVCVLVYGFDVVVWDLVLGVEVVLCVCVVNVWLVLWKQGLVFGVVQECLCFVVSIEECVGDVDFIQESVFEWFDLKFDLYVRISVVVWFDVLIGFFILGLLFSEFYVEVSYFECCLVGYLFNLVYLLLLVEVVGGECIVVEVVWVVMWVYELLGMCLLYVCKEVFGFIVDCLFEVFWCEVLYLVNDGVVMIGEIDDVICFGVGLCWLFMGIFLIYILVGGNVGMCYFMVQFGLVL